MGQSTQLLFALPQLPGLLLFVLFLLGPVALLGAGAYALTVPALRRRWLGFAAVPFLFAAFLAAYVFGEDSYRGDDISRWDAYRSPGGELDELFFFTILVLLGCGAVLGYASVRGRRWMFSTWAFVTVLAVPLVYATFIGFSTN
jgi:hypothetical protein